LGNVDQDNILERRERNENDRIFAGRAVFLNFVPMHSNDEEVDWDFALEVNDNLPGVMAVPH
jgi:hypothetical protein